MIKLICVIEIAKKGMMSMNFETSIKFNNKDYKIITCENEYIIHPTTFGLYPINTQSDFTSTYVIRDYQLFLEQLDVFPDGISNDTNGINATSIEQYIFNQQPLTFTGSILIASEFLREYSLKGCETNPCFCYKYVYELVFRNGILTTSIDHSKAMLRIRKNIELGLRSLNKNRDVKCIIRFMKTSFVGNYRKLNSLKKKKSYQSLLKRQYENKIVSFSLKN